ncbi:MAG TPA: RcpC/CpaB family pilus assembly protein [Mycobacteriales bacterium]|nr:RcpC/CpaB family pilus assembly protein [Mycobacteriales bacterium]
MRKLNASIVIGIIVAIIGASSVVAYGRSVNHRIADGKRTQSVLVADHALVAGSSAAALKGDVHTMQVPGAFAVDGAIASLSNVADGQVLLTAVPKGGQLASSSFGDPAEAGRLAPAVGDVALAVQTDISPGVARYLTAGQLVDVFVTYNDVRNASGKPTFASDRTKLFVTGVKVLAVSVAQAPTQTTSGHSVFSNASSAQQSQMLQDKVIAVLDLTPTDAERLVNAQALGSIYLGYTLKGGDTTPTGVIPDDVVRSNR